jgi:hypothetical protein
MVLVMVGAVLVLMGLFSGLTLVAVPLGLVPWSLDFTLPVLFPLFTLVGYALCIVGARSTRIHGLSFGVSCLLLLLALAAAVGLVLAATGITRLAESTWPLWYVLVVAGVLGSIGTASRGRLDAAA